MIIKHTLLFASRAYLLQYAATDDVVCLAAKATALAL
jgi:hypothetical protein